MYCSLQIFSSNHKLVALILLLSVLPQPLFAEGEWETTPHSEKAVDRGLEWLARHQGVEGNWGSKHLGLVSMGALAFLSAGHAPGRGKYGDVVEKALSYVIRNSKPSGLLNIDQQNRDMYNHGLATFVLGQAHGMTNDPQISKTLDRALKLIYDTQCEDGGWDYVARSQRSGHDLSLAVMQAKAIRSAMDSGLDVPTSVIRMAIKSVREHYKPEKGNIRSQDDARIRIGPGQFTYSGSRTTPAMAAAGVVCLQEFGQYDDWRIPKNISYLKREVFRHQKEADTPFEKAPHNGRMPFDAYTLYYLGQAMYQVGGEDWKSCYPVLRDSLVNGQHIKGSNSGAWEAGRHVSGREGQLYGTAVACFVLSMPNRYLPILQEGKIESVRKKVNQ